MAYKKYELKLSFVIDDTNEDVVEYVRDLKEGVLSGDLQRELLSEEGITDVKMTFKEL